MRGGWREEFGFEGLGTLGSLGRGAAVTDIFGVKSSGLLGFCGGSIYLTKMPGLNRKVPDLRRLTPPSTVSTTAGTDQAGLVSAIRNQHYETDDVMFRQGDLGDSVRVIKKRECEVF